MTKQQKILKLFKINIKTKIYKNKKKTIKYNDTKIALLNLVLYFNLVLCALK